MNGIVFPQKGRVYQKFSLTSLSQDKFRSIDYSFEVLNVKRLDKFSPKEWLPKIPSGTTVKNDIIGETIEIPLSDKQKEELAKLIENSVPVMYSPMTFIFRIILIVAGLILIILALYRPIKNRKIE